MHDQPGPYVGFLFRCYSNPYKLTCGLKIAAPLLAGKDGGHPNEAVTASLTALGIVKGPDLRASDRGGRGAEGR